MKTSKLLISGGILILILGSFVGGLTYKEEIQNNLQRFLPDAKVVGIEKVISLDTVPPIAKQTINRQFNNSNIQKVTFKTYGETREVYVLE